MTAELTVYVVDDDPSIRKSLSKALTLRGLTVEVFDSAISFLEQHTAEIRGCLLLDLSMPGMNGLELQQELLNRGATMPIIFITGHGSVPESVQALKGGAIDFLEKPFRQETLLQRIDEAFVEEKRLRSLAENKKDIQSRFDRLTDREHDVLKLMVSGPANRSSKVIARELGISHRTVDHHRARIMEKIQVQSVAELARLTDLLDKSTSTSI